METAPSIRLFPHRRHAGMQDRRWGLLGQAHQLFGSLAAGDTPAMTDRGVLSRSFSRSRTTISARASPAFCAVPSSAIPEWMRTPLKGAYARGRLQCDEIWSNVGGKDKKRVARETQSGTRLDLNVDRPGRAEQAVKGRRQDNHSRSGSSEVSGVRLAQYVHPDRTHSPWVGRRRRSSGDARLINQ
jgi:hypothetical protein